ncbi:hypothetical protein [Paraburkholderia hospita]|uniref:hypothetical protein n=1 Tax=Paraburkholderia hospita TaxID=169430 RepID=UPI000B85E28E|nr:hypothetical protein [Paraburkholderia hospita]
MTGTSNKRATGGVLWRGDLVQFDRNNHKPLHRECTCSGGATPFILPTARNAFGMIGAVVLSARVRCCCASR